MLEVKEPEEVLVPVSVAEVEETALVDVLPAGVLEKVAGGVDLTITVNPDVLDIDSVPVSEVETVVDVEPPLLLVVVLVLEEVSPPPAIWKGNDS